MLTYCEVTLWEKTFHSALNVLTHWGRVTHICVSKLTIICSDNGLSPGRRQAIIWTNAGILLIRSLGTNLSETLIEIHAFSFEKIHLKMSSAKRRLFCLGLNLLISLHPPASRFINNTSPVCRFLMVVGGAVGTYPDPMYTEVESRGTLSEFSSLNPKLATPIAQRLEKRN